MMKIKKKSKKLIAVLMAGLVAASSIPLSLLSADETYAADSVSVKLDTGSSIIYGGNGSTHKFTATVAGDETTAFCIEPDKYAPSDGTYSASSISNTGKVAHTMYFCYGYPGQSKLKAWLNDNGYGAHASGNSFYALSHVLLSYAYDSSDAFTGWSNGHPSSNINSSYQSMVKKAYSYVSSLDAPIGANAEISFSKGAEAKWTKDLEFKSSIIKLTGNSSNYVTYSVPSDMTLHMDDKEYKGGSSVKIYGGKSFYLTTNNMDRADTTYTSPALSGYLKGYTAYKIAGSSSKQTMAFFAVDDVKNASFSVKFGPIKAPIKIVKIDKETGNRIPQAGVTFEIYDDKSNLVETVKTDSTGRVTTGAFKPGTYFVKEIKAPTGYTVNPDKQKIEITPLDCAIGEVTFTMKNPPQKGIINITKYGDYINNAGNKDEELLSNIKFKITAAEDIYSGDTVTKFYSKGDVADELTTDINGKASSKKLPLGKYTVSEVGAFDRNTGEEIKNFRYHIVDGEHRKDITLSAAEQNISLVYGNVTERNDGIPKIGTSAKDSKTKDHEGEYSQHSTIIDTVSFVRLEPGKEYTVKGKLMDAHTGNPVLIDGKEITSEKSFVPKSYNGSVDISFTFDSTKLKGKTVVVFEDLYRGDIKVASHADIKDRNQTITYPELKTSAMDLSTASHMGQHSENAVIIDTVSYENLVIGNTYTVKGTLMNKETGKPLEKDGSPITAERTFTVETKSGTIEMRFELDSRELQGETVVVFEDLYRNDIHVAAHADISDLEQSITYPEIKTTAMDSETKDNQGHIADKVTITDTVSYTGLDINKEYTVKGILMDKASGKPLMANDKEIISEKAFIPAKPNGSVDVTFEVDSRLLKGTTTVVFEALYLDNIELAVHSDLEDAGQSIYWPDIKTSAKDTKTDTNTGSITRFDKITDTISYTNLIPGKIYNVRGILMDKESGEPLKVDGKEITSEKTFIPKDANGKIELSFYLDSRSLEKKTVVVFEDLYHKDVKIATHADINDNDQTITYPKLPKTPKTGDETNLLIYGALALASAAALALLRRRAKKKDDDDTDII